MNGIKFKRTVILTRSGRETDACVALSPLRCFLSNTATRTITRTGTGRPSGVKLQLEQAALARARASAGHGQSQMLVRPLRDLPPARRPHQESFLDQIRLVDVLQRVAVLGQRCGHRLDADRAAVEA